ncbi:MAG: tRNA (adenosine(37)-N6)-dimethylallyltransferase MiaA [Phototrophicaceae bacterium]
MTGKLDPLIIVLGATAIGKTGLAIEIAQALNGEIVGADSRQIYQYMDIGTAKPSSKEQENAVHHLIDFVKPDEDFTLAQYQDRAYSAINDIHARGKFPLLVGGTGQYLTAIEEGWSIPRVPPNEAIRQDLYAEVERIGRDAFHAKLEAVDPESADKIHPNNVRRVVRALEVYLETGTAISVLQQKKPPPYRIMIIGLKMEREALYQRADKRVDIMIENGFVNEVQRLLDMGYNRNLASMSALGYREIGNHLLDDLDLEEAIQLTKNSTHNFIRRQEIWFRGHDNGILWHNIETLKPQHLINHIAQWMQES